MIAMFKKLLGKQEDVKKVAKKVDKNQKEIDDLFDRMDRKVQQREGK